MKITKILSILLLLTAIAAAQPQITPVNFLNTRRPERMCQGYFDEEYGLNYFAFAQPTGGAVMRIDEGSHEHYKYIFTDRSFNRLMIFSLDDYSGKRVPVGAKAYGREIPPITFRIGDGQSTVTPPFPQRDSAECFYGPVDVVVSSKHGYFDPEKDRIYVLDQDNLRVVILSYDPKKDSLIWEGTFGEHYLNMPTALDYASYDDPDYDNHDIYVTDGVNSKIYRFSADGDYEAEFGSWGYGMDNIGYPSGIAIPPYSVEPNTFYISDSNNHRVVKYHSDTEGAIHPEWRYTFPLPLISEEIPFLKGIDIDSCGNIYVIDNFNDNITILSPDLNETLFSYNREPGPLDHPRDIYIDGIEMLICERWGKETGINTFTIKTEHPKIIEVELPEKFELYQNYPNPFNSWTTFRFDLPIASDIHLTVYNNLGQKVIDLENGYLPAGTHFIHWDARNSAGNKISSGVYFYRIDGEKYQSVKKMMHLK